MSEFDRAAPTYDRSRRPPSQPELSAVADSLAGCRSILDVGTGTGRYALLLEKHGFGVLGVDLSRPMLGVARSKGLRGLVQANAFRLPLRDGAMDGTVSVHVLQVAPDPIAMLSEMARVSRTWVVGVLPPDPEVRKRSITDPFQQAWERYSEEVERRGFKMQFSAQRTENRQRILKDCPPTKVVRVEDPVPFFPADMTWEDVRLFSGLFDLPPEVHAEIVGEIGPLPAQEVPTSPRIVEVARWDPGSFKRR